MTLNQIPDSLIFPGLIGGGGINRSVNSTGLQIGELLQANNVAATQQGFSNISQGVGKLNTSTVSAAIQGGTVYQGKHVVVVNGNIYTMPLSGGAYTLKATGVFAATDRVSFAAAKGTATDKLYMAGGSMIPQWYDGSTTGSVSGFSSTILSTFNPSDGYPDKVAFFQGRLVWNWKSTSPYKNYVLFSAFLNADRYTQNTPVDNTDPFFEEVAPGQGYISAITSIRQSLQNYQQEVLAVYKAPGELYLSSQISFDNSLLATTFNRQALDIGAINQQSTVGFANSVLSLSKQGIGEIQSATVSGSVDVKTYEFGNRVNPLIKTASQSSNFTRAWALHCPGQQMIWFNMPDSISTQTTNNGFSYPEVPNSLTICFYYGILNQDGNIYNCWATKSGAGWGWSTGWTDGTNIYLGSYFGNVYLFGTGSEYERNPNTNTVMQPFTSTVETGDYTWDGSSFSVKNLKSLDEQWYGVGVVNSTTCVYKDQASNGVCISKSTSFGGSPFIWGQSLWGGASWSKIGNSYLQRAGFGVYGTSLRLRTEWSSLNATGQANGGSLFGYRGLYNIGNRLSVQRLR